MKGEENLYTCPKCGGYTVTVDRDQGVTPFMINCRASGSEGDCDGMAESAFYPKGPRTAHIPAPSWEWYKVERWEVMGDHRVETKEYHSLDPGLKDHVDKGGLLIRKIDPSFTIERQISELKAAGWVAKTPTLWKSPSGKLFLGPHGAWKAMTSLGKVGHAPGS